MRDSSYLQLQSWKSAVCYTTWTITNKKSTPKVPVYFIPDRCCDWTSGASELLIFRQKVHKEWVWCAETSPSLSTKHHDISCWQWLHRNDKQYTNRSLSQSCKAWITYLWQTVGGHGLSNDPNTEYTHLVLTANLCQYRQSSATWQRNWPSTSNNTQLVTVLQFVLPNRSFLRKTRVIFKHFKLHGRGKISQISCF